MITNRERFMAALNGEATDRVLSPPDVPDY
jgi:hypothetical protein